MLEISMTIIDLDMCCFDSSLGLITKYYNYILVATLSGGLTLYDTYDFGMLKLITQKVKL